MPKPYRVIVVRVAAVAGLIATLALGGAARQAPASADTLGQLNSQLGAQQARQQRLSSSVQSMSRLISSLSSQIALVQSREDAVRAQIVIDRAAVARASAALDRERAVVDRLRRRLAFARMLLSRQVVSSYEGDHPDLVSVVITANGFNSLLEQINFLSRAEHQQQAVITITRQAKQQADAATARLASLQAKDRQATAAAELRARALAGMNALLAAKQQAISRARYAQPGAARCGGRACCVAALADRADPRRAGRRRGARRRRCPSCSAGRAECRQLASGTGRTRPERRLGDPLRDRAV